LVAAKGAPEALLRLCHLDSAAAAVWQQRLEEMAARGWRVIGVAQAAWFSDQLPERQTDFEFSFLGLVALADPLRPETKTAVVECHQAGIRVVMITGDYSVTAANIARQLDLAWQKVVSGPELAAMDQVKIRTVLSTTDIFARVTPEQKLLLVEALKAERQIVAMTGDGVNDAPALKAAHIGIAIGQRGTDVAREAASIVLLDDRFVSIVSGMKLGRRIYDNLQKAVGYLISVHLPIIALSLVPVFFDSPLILLPAHIVFLELIIDPTCSIVFEMEKSDPDLMNRPPRPWSAKLFNWRLLAPHLFSGLVAAAVIFVPYYHYLRVGTPEQARLVAFGSLILINIFLIFSSRFRRRNYRSLLANRAAWLVSAGALSLFVAVIFIPLTAHLFGFSQFQTSFLPWMFGAALTVAIFSIIFQRLAKKRG
jgi:Ca2+-transporting ATPase